MWRVAGFKRRTPELICPSHLLTGSSSVSQLKSAFVSLVVCGPCNNSNYTEIRTQINHLKQIYEISDFLGTKSAEQSHSWTLMIWKILASICPSLQLFIYKIGTQFFPASLKVSIAVLLEERKESSQSSKKFVCSIVYQDTCLLECRGSQQPCPLSIMHLYSRVNDRHITASNPSGALGW